MFFLATPHRGSNLAKTLNRILDITPILTPRYYVNDITKNSEVTAVIMMNFVIIPMTCTFGLVFLRNCKDPDWPPIIIHDR